MRNGISAIFAVLVAAVTAAANAIEMDDGAAESLDEDVPGWTWEDGLLGDAREGDVFTDAEDLYPGWACPDCRDPVAYPLDFAAFAYNGFWGQEPWMMGSRLGVPFRVYNLQLDWVAVWFEDVYFDSFTFLPDTLEVHIRLTTGQILTFTLLQGGPDLPVGSQPGDVEPGAEAGGDGSGGGSGGDGDDDGAVEDDAEPELPDYAGSVEIVDPDEDGEFPPWEEEL